MSSQGSNTPPKVQALVKMTINRNTFQKVFWWRYNLWNNRGWKPTNDKKFKIFKIDHKPRLFQADPKGFRYDVRDHNGVSKLNIEVYFIENIILRWRLKNVFVHALILNFKFICTIQLLSNIMTGLNNFRELFRKKKSDRTGYLFIWLNRKQN